MENKPAQSVAFLCNASPRWSPRLAQVLRSITAFPAFGKEIFPVDRKQLDSIESCLSKILSGSFDAIVVIGGDGSLNRAVNFLAARNALDRFTLAVAPFGTCNDFAKTLGLRPGEIAPVLTALAQGRTREIRVARVNRHFFLNNAGFGRRAPEKKAGGPLATLRAMRPAHLRLRDGVPVEGDFLMMLCANAPYFSNGLHFDRRSDPTEVLSAS